MTTTTDLEPEHQRWLKLNEYDSIDEWARDSDFHRNDACEDGIWIDDQGQEQDIAAALAGAIEAQICPYEVTVINVFDATDQADAVEQMIEWLTAHGGARAASYRWERLDRLTLNGEELPHETGLIDAEDMP